MRELGRGDVSTDRSTVARYLERWLEHISATKSLATIRNYRGKIKRLNEKLGFLQLSRLTAQHLDGAYRKWLDEGMHPTTVHHMHGVMSAALNQAVNLAGARQRGLGHADATTTLRVYSHMIEGRDREAAEILGSLLAYDEHAALDKSTEAGVAPVSMDR